MTIAPELIQRIKDEADIVGVINSYINLEKKGTSYWGICPFHPDTNPSLSVSPEKGIWKCFTCGASGNVFGFVSRYLKVPFPEAVKIVGEKCGIKIEEKEEDEKTKLLRRYHNILDNAKEFYQFYLKNTVDGSSAREYLKERDLNPDIIKYFNIGLAPNSFDGLFKALTNDNTYLPAELVEVGLCKINPEKKNYYDIFRHRIIFPIDDVYGNTVGFSGRLYEKNDKEPKYINSNDNIVFRKGNILYNYSRAINDIKLHDTVYLMEGFMDVIAAYKAGIKNVVATMGTALTQNHINFLEKNAKKIVICYDGDNAGVNATKKAIILLKNSSITVQTVMIPEKLDPDEYLKKYGEKALNNVLSSPINPIDYLYDSEVSNLNKNDITSCENFKNNIFKYMKFYNSQTLNEALIKKISMELNISTQSILNDFNNDKSVIEVVEIIPEPVPELTEKPTKGKRRKKNKYDKAEDQIIVFAYQNQENCNYVAGLLALGQCVKKEKRNILLKLIDYYRDNELMNIEIFEKDLTEEEKRIIEKIIKLPIPMQIEIESLADVISEYQIEKKNEMIFKELEEKTINVSTIQEFINVKQKTVKIKEKK